MVVGLVVHIVVGLVVRIAVVVGDKGQHKGEEHLYQFVADASKTTFDLLE